MKTRGLHVARLLMLAGAGCSPSPESPPAPQPAPVVEKPAAPPSRSPVVAARVRRPDRYDFNGEIPGVQTLDEFRSRHAKSAEQPYASAGHEVPGIVQEIVGQHQLTVAGRDVLRAEYTFVDGILARIDLYCEAQRLHETAAAIREEHGDPDEEVAGRRTWEGTRGNLRLTIREQSLVVTFEDQQLSAEIVRRVLATQSVRAKPDSEAP